MGVGEVGVGVEGLGWGRRVFLISIVEIRQKILSRSTYYTRM